MEGGGGSLRKDPKYKRRILRTLNPRPESPEARALKPERTRHPPSVQGGLEGLGSISLDVDFKVFLTLAIYIQKPKSPNPTTKRTQTPDPRRKTMKPKPSEHEARRALHQGFTTTVAITRR